MRIESLGATSVGASYRSRIAICYSGNRRISRMVIDASVADAGAGCVIRAERNIASVQAKRHPYLSY